MKKITVAFDVKGTLVGARCGGEKVHKLFKWFEAKGCHMIIWSSVYSYAEAAKSTFGYKAKLWPKRDKLDEEDLLLNPHYNVDIAVDDDNFIEHNGKIIPFLACNHMIIVSEIPEESKFEEMYGHLLG